MHTSTPYRGAVRPAVHKAFVLLAIAALLVAACGASATTTPGAGAATATASVASPAAPSAAAAAAPTGSSPGGAGPVATSGATPRPIRTPNGPLRPAPVASRVVVADYDIDLPVVSGDLQPPPANYPLCDVAQYLTKYGNPGQPGSTYVYAHARDRMFGALLEASTRDDGAELIGKAADVYREDGQLFTYRIVEVERHATEYRLADEVPQGVQRLILQTSEGPYGTVPKLLIAADLVSSAPVDLAEANPVARPRDCRPAQLIPSGQPGSGAAAIASRVVIPGFGIDLPVVSSGLEVPGNPPDYPLCDVAQYLTTYEQPGSVGTTWLYAHAQPKMFLPLLQASERERGKKLLGEAVQVYTSDGQLFHYEIFVVKPHATDYTLADEVGSDEHRLVLQTSEGPNGTIPKLQIGARLVNIETASVSAANPAPRPRSCPPPGVLATPTPNTGGTPAP